MTAAAPNDAEHEDLEAAAVEADEEADDEQRREDGGEQDHDRVPGEQRGGDRHERRDREQHEQQDEPRRVAAPVDGRPGRDEPEPATARAP